MKRMLLSFSVSDSVFHFGFCRIWLFQRTQTSPVHMSNQTSWNFVWIFIYCQYFSVCFFFFRCFFWFDRRGSTHAHYSIILLSIPTLPSGVSLDLSKLFLSMHTHTHTHSIGNTLQHPSLVFSSKYARWFSILMGDEIGRNISLKRNGDVTPSSRKEKTKKVDMQVRRKLMLTRSQKVKTSFIKPL